MEIKSIRNINTLFLWCVLLCVSTLSAQQITTDSSLSVQQLIENNLVTGCVQVSNISSPVNGSVSGINSFGFFEKGTSNFPFENGIVITSGDVNDAGNTTNSGNLNKGNTAWGTDPDLNASLGINNTLNATTISFDFISGTDSIQFNYILASEEYQLDYPCKYSDGFAFLIREAGSAGPYQNIAIIPGTTTPVNTTNVRPEIVGGCAAQNETFFNGFNVGDTNYNGRTTVMTASATITPNVLYNIKFIIADQGDQNSDSAVFIQSNSFDNTVELGDAINTCNSSANLDATTNNPQSTYEWTLNGTTLATTTSTLTANASGTYAVTVTTPLAGSNCTFTDSVIVNVNNIQDGPDINDFVLCDDVSNDGRETFNLTNLEAQMLAGIPASPGGYTISYHFTNTQASSGSSPVTNPTTFQNSVNPQSIFIRAEDNTTGCVHVSPVSLRVSPFPIITDPSPFFACEGSGGADLTTINNTITGAVTGLTVSYHRTPTDASSGADPIAMPYSPAIGSTETLHIRVTNGDGCFTTTTIDVSVTPNPVINTELQQIDGCDTDNDGFANFDITSVEADILDGATGVTTTYHTSQDDADADINPIANATAFDNTVQFEQPVFIRVENTTTGCFTTHPIELHSQLLDSGTEHDEYRVCDDNSDSIKDINIGDLGDAIIGTLAPDILIGTSIIIYPTPDNHVPSNALDPAIPYIVDGSDNATNGDDILYFDITSATCTWSGDITIIINPPVIIPTIPNQSVCDTDDDTSNYTIDLSQFNPTLNTAINISPLGFTYFETEQNAIDNVGIITGAYNGTSDPLQLWFRATNLSTTCFGIGTFEVDILPTPTTTTPSNEVFCTNNGDTKVTINLEDKLNEAVTSTTGLVVSYHNSLATANNNTLPIANPTAYSAGTNTGETIFIRIANSTSGCFFVEQFSVIVNTQPVIPTISDFVKCNNQGTGIQAQFLFSDKDAEILNGFTDKEVFYYPTLADANTDTNRFDKTVDYTNTAQEEDIFIRIQNLTDTTCASTGSFKIKVGAIPDFTLPVNPPVCDDASNDGMEPFNLEDIRNQIINNSTDTVTVMFYLTEDNARNEVNPIDTTVPFTNTSNPQGIFLNIDNKTICDGIAEYALQVKAIPTANPTDNIRLCDTNTDGRTAFDLTINQAQTFGIRQDDVVAHYYPSQLDYDNKTNEITTPTSYINQTNPQTIVVQLIQTSTNPSAVLCDNTTSFEISVEVPPTIPPNQTFHLCENALNIFDLSTTRDTFIDNQANIVLEYYRTRPDAETQTNQIIGSNFDYGNNISTTLFVRSNFELSACFNIESFRITENQNPIANPISPIGICDGNFDRIEFFDLTQQTSVVLGAQSAANFTVGYYNTQNDADNKTNEITPANNVESSNNQDYFIRIENNTTGCFSTSTFKTLVYRKPIVDIKNTTLCLDDLPLKVSANTGIDTDSYQWSTGATTSNINITTIGSYTVTVTTANNCTNAQTFNVIQSEAANITFTESIDFSDPNVLTITVDGTGDYLYQFDNGTPQTSNVFINVPIGLHKVTVIDKNGCTPTTKDVVIVDVPQFMTPNNDGYFDTWHITGVEKLTGTIVYIFDRYGKLLKTLTHESVGWDGMYNGARMPASDYWYLAKVKKGSIEIELKGHFTLRR